MVADKRALTALSRVSRSYVEDEAASFLYFFRNHEQTAPQFFTGNIIKKEKSFSLDSGNSFFP